MSQILRDFWHNVVGTAAGAGAARQGFSKAVDAVEETLGEPLLTSIRVSPENRTIVGAGSVFFSAFGTYSDGFEDTTLALREIDWSSEPPGIVEIDYKGDASTRGVAGSVKIIATVHGSDVRGGEIAGSTTLTVLEPGRGARKTSVHIRVKNLKGELVTGLADLRFNARGATEVKLRGEIENGQLDFADVLLMPQGTVALEAYLGWNRVVSDPSAYKLPTSGLIQFHAAQKADTPTNTFDLKQI